MGAEIEIYYLYRDKKGSHILLCVHRDSYSNADEGYFDFVCRQMEEKISEFIKGKSLELIGCMEYLPIGEGLYSAQDGDVLDIFYCHNSIDNKYIILGTGENESEFLEEAAEEYKDEVDSNNINRVNVVFHKK